MSDQCKPPLRQEKHTNPLSLILFVESILYAACQRKASKIIVECDLSPSVYKIRFLDNGSALEVETISHNWIRSSRDAQITSSNKQRWTFHQGAPQNYELNAHKDTSDSSMNEMVFSGFLYSYPVRQKILHPYKDVEDVRINVIVPYSLLHYDVSFVLIENRRKEIVYSIDKNTAIIFNRKARLLHHLHYSKIPCSERHLKEVSYKMETFHILGLMCTLGISSDKQQYLYLNGRNVHKCKVYTFINEFWKKNSLQTSVPSYPCFLLVIKCPENEYFIKYESRGIRVEFVRWKLLAQLLKKAFLQFMSDKNTLGGHVRPRVHGDGFSISGVRPLESTSNEDPRIMSHVLKRKQHSSQFEIVDLHDGARKGLPAKKLRNPDQDFTRVLDDDLFAKNTEQEDEIISSVRSTDFPDSFGIRSQSLKNTSLQTSSSSNWSSEKIVPECPNRFLNDSVENDDLNFPLSSTMQTVDPHDQSTHMNNSSSNFISAPHDDSLPQTSIMNATKETPFNFMTCDMNHTEQESHEISKINKENNQDTLNVNVTETSEVDSIGPNCASNRKIYKEFLIKEMEKIKAKLKELSDNESESNSQEPAKLSKSVQTSPCTSPRGFILQSQVTTTTLQIETKDKSIQNEETHATFRMIDKTLLYPENSILKSANIPEGWIRKSLANGEDIYIHVESGFTANSLDHVLKKTDPQSNKRLLDVVRDRGGIPSITYLPKSDEETSKILDTWKNPIMESNGDNILSIVAKSDGGNTLKAIENVKFDKSVFQNLEILHQLDNKVIITLLNDETIVLLDQHAVHERIRLETLIKDHFSDHTVTSVELPSPIAASLSPSVCRLLQEYPTVLQRFGLRHLDITSEDVLVFSHVPACFIYQEGRYSSSTPLKELVVSLCQDIYQNVLDLGTETKILPTTIRDVLNSQACRGAIKFGDPLTLEKCEELIRDLAKCQTPFQCAHGRPSIAPIINLKSLKISPAYRKKHFTRIDFIRLKYNRFVK